VLAPEELLSLLVDRQLLSAAAIMEGEIEVNERSSRNYNLEIRCSGAPSYFVKIATDDDTQQTLRREAALYHAIAGPAVPRLHFFDERGVLVLELLDHPEVLASYYRRVLKLPLSLAAQVGAILATLHESGAPRAAALDAAGEPFVLDLDRPSLSLYLSLSGPNLQLLGAIHDNPAYKSAIAAARAGWRANAGGLVHGDVKWENWVLSRPERRLADGRVLLSAAQLKLLDWELGGRGDSLWDVGSMLGSFLSLWAESIPALPDTPPAHVLELASLPFREVQPSIAELWESYCRGVPHARARTADVARYAGLRLLRTAFEMMQRSSVTITIALCVAQIGLNMVRDPLDAAQSLLGMA
jgi:hypothetical protein